MKRGGVNTTSDTALFRGANRTSSRNNLSSPASSCNGKKVLVKKDFYGAKWLVFNREERLYRSGAPQSHFERKSNPLRQKRPIEAPECALRAVCRNFHLDRLSQQSPSPHTATAVLRTSAEISDHFWAQGSRRRSVSIAICSFVFELRRRSRRRLGRRKCEPDRDSRLHLHGMSILGVRPVPPLPHGLDSCPSQHRISIDHRYVVHRSLFSDLHI
jgi:hypothetical protein